MIDKQLIIPCGKSSLLTNNVKFESLQQNYEMRPVHYIILITYQVCPWPVLASSHMCAGLCCSGSTSQNGKEKQCEMAQVPGHNPCLWKIQMMFLVPGFAPTAVALWNMNLPLSVTVTSRINKSFVWLFKNFIFIFIFHYTVL